MYSLAFIAVALPFASATLLSARTMVLHERRETVPTGFVKVGAAPKQETLTLRLGLVQGDMSALEERLYAVSTPSSSEYGKFLSKEEVESFVTPKQETIDSVNAFLSENGIKSSAYSPAGDILQIDLTVEQANSLFATTFDTFKHTSTGSETVRTLEYSIPVSLKDHLSFVHPTTMFPVQLNHQPLTIKPVPAQSNSSLTKDATVPASCSSTITPACLQAMYGLPSAPATQSSNKLAVSGFIEQYANEADLKTFLTDLRTDIDPSTTFTLETIDGGENPQSTADAGVEADLDVQYTIGVATGVPTSFISVGEDQSDDIFGFQDIIEYLLAMDNPPHVLTTSYGANEDEISAGVADSLCNAYMQLGARGTTILFSSGDGGVAGSQTTSCSAQFLATFPSGCPYMTSVGATSGYPEVAADFSSGGFSNLFSTPDYQADAVAAYLETLGSEYSGKYNASGRAFPDIAAAGVNCEIVYQGQTGLVDGTSCSSPIFAATIALLNDELVAAGKSPLGFLNPWLYSTAASAFTDITSGSNPGCGTDGFPAVSGWDPVTGLGTPNYDALRTAAGL
ncbi:family S53 protease-like protein [Peniophora sp. CONT]|nr:family S53 protease-like protein [Peniophora sp. CONT]